MTAFRAILIALFSIAAFSAWKLPLLAAPSAKSVPERVSEFGPAVRQRLAPPSWPQA